MAKETTRDSVSKNMVLLTVRGGFIWYENVIDKSLLCYQSRLSWTGIFSKASRSAERRNAPVSNVRTYAHSLATSSSFVSLLSSVVFVKIFSDSFYRHRKCLLATKKLGLILKCRASTKLAPPTSWRVSCMARGRWLTWIPFWCDVSKCLK